MLHQRMRECMECFETFYTAELPYLDLARLLETEEREARRQKETLLFEVLLCATRQRGYVTFADIESALKAEDGTIIDAVEALIEQLDLLQVPIVDEDQIAVRPASGVIVE